MGAFDVVITGFKLNGRESAAKVLERVLGEQPDSAKALAKSFPSVVRHALAPAEADAVVLALRAAGARVEVRAAGAPVAPAAAPSAPTASAVAGLIAAQPRPASVPVPADQGLQLGTARIAEPPRERKSSGRYILGTLKILLNGPPPPPPQQPAVMIKPAPEPALSADDALHATGMRDDAFDDVGAHQPLELDDAALQERSNHVSGGRREQKERPSLLDIVADIPMRVVRRAKPKQPEVEAEPGALASLESRHPYIWHAFVGVGLLVCLGLSLAIIYKTPPAPEVAVATAQGVPDAPPPGGDQAPAQAAATLGPQDLEAEAPALHPILQIAPKPMEPALAGILRKQVSGTHAVRIDWGDSGPPSGERVSCMVISGNAQQQRERAHSVLTTGRRYPMTPMLERQMHDHMEVMRLADGDPKAKYTPLCVAN